MSLKREYKLNLPQLLWGGLSENWLLKELGDIHWQQIAEALGTASGDITDAEGTRLLASFVRVRWSGANLGSFHENEAITFDSDLSYYKDKLFFSQTKCGGNTEKLKADLMSAFSRKGTSDNTALKIGGIGKGIDSKQVRKYSRMPSFGKEHLASNVRMPEASLHQTRYQIDPYDDINGVGLLYFAHYPRISDKCERHYLHAAYELEQDWLQSAGVVARDIHYYGNANADDALMYELNALEHQDRRLTLISSLYRSVDGKLIARMTTTKELAEGVVLKKRSTPRKHTVVATPPESSSVKVTPSTAVSEGCSVTKVAYDQAALNRIVIDFLGSMLGVSDLTPQSDLHALGIESMVYQELSEFLKDQHQLPNNPSRFYGTSTIAALTDDLLESLSAGQPSSSLDTPQEHSRVSAAVSSTASSEAIAIIGISGQFPGSPDVETFWEHLKAGRDLITEVPKDRWDWKEYYGDPQQEQRKMKSKWGGFMEGIDAFDPLFFGISPREAMLMDPQQRLTLEASWHALEDAGVAPHQLKGSDAGVFMGVSGSDYAQVLQTAGKSTEAYDVLGSAASILANRVSYFLDVHGPSQVIDTACSSSLVAVHEAVRNLKDGSCSLAIAGGVSALLSPKLT
ncbi:MAG: Pnap_2097 family protein, partial [Bacteroidota bacterium]